MLRRAPLISVVKGRGLSPSEPPLLYVCGLLVHTLSDSLLISSSMHRALWVGTGWWLLQQGTVMSRQSTNMSRHGQNELWWVFNSRWDNIVFISVFEQWEWRLLCCDSACGQYVFPLFNDSMCECVWGNMYIYVAMSLHLCLGLSVYFFVSLTPSLFFSKPFSHRVCTREDLSEQLWDRKEEMSTEYTTLFTCSSSYSYSYNYIL